MFSGSSNWSKILKQLKILNKNLKPLVNQANQRNCLDLVNQDDIDFLMKLAKKIHPKQTRAFAASQLKHQEHQNIQSNIYKLKESAGINSELKIQPRSYPHVQMREWFDRHNDIDSNWFVSQCNPTEYTMYTGQNKPTDNDRLNPPRYNIFELTDGDSNFIEVTNRHELLVHYFGMPMSTNCCEGDSHQTSPQQFLKILNLAIKMCDVYHIKLLKNGNQY